MKAIKRNTAADLRHFDGGTARFWSPDLRRAVMKVRPEYRFQEKARRKEHPDYSGNPYHGSLYLHWARLYVDGQFAYATLWICAWMRTDRRESLKNYNDRSGVMSRSVMMLLMADRCRLRAGGGTAAHGPKAVIKHGRSGVPNYPCACGGTFMLPMTMRKAISIHMQV